MSVSDQIGRVGEDYFQLLANQAQLIVGQVNPDRIGKDRIVEFELADKNHVSFDKRPAPRSASVQIKTILKSNDRVTVSLSVAERLAKDPRPTFICIIRVDDEFEVVDMFLVHLLDAQLEKILKRLRQEYSEGNEKLHKASTSFTIADGIEVKRTAKGLKSAFSSIIPEDMENYSKEKFHQIENLGFDATSFLTSNITFSNLTTQDFVDGMLGLKKLDVVSLEVLEERFGIKLPLEMTQEVPNGPGVLEVKPTSSTKGVVSLRNTAQDLEAKIECDLVFPGIPNLPLEHLKFIARTEVCDFIIGQDKFKIEPKNSIMADAKLSLEHWINLLTSWEVTSQDDFEVSIYTPEGKRLITGMCNQSDTSSRRTLIGDITICQQLQKIREHVSAPDSEISLAEIVASQNEIQLAYCCFFEPDTISGDWNFKLDATFPVEKTNNQTLLIYSFSVGSEEYAFGLRLDVDVTHTEKHIELSAKSFSALQLIRVGIQFKSMKVFEDTLYKISGISLRIVSSRLEDSPVEAANNSIIV
ncbi:hypothetical protein [Cognatishimia activa]|uniref:hypothetical protein n=1 Tax=Cognatishimia activa TaxID=1715691 RepID=UPI00222FD456|nr:hypothetical protein [Cognatishimia activa]UZD92119.1 hypothetical protein M0D42_05790 [Cognatishimia activa]